MCTCIHVLQHTNLTNVSLYKWALVHTFLHDSTVGDMFCFFQDLNCSSVLGLGDSVAISETRELGQFTRRFTTTLFLCPVTELTAGVYECIVNRSRGDENNVMVWSAEVFPITPTTPLHVQHTDGM